MAENYKFVNYAGAEMAELFDKIADLDVATQSKAGLMSDTDKTKLDNLPAGAQVNVLEGVQLAGTDLSISGKKVNIPVDNAPTEGSSALIRSGAVFSALAGIHQFRVVIVTELPASGEELVLYLVGPTGTGPDKYEEYLWNNNAWVKIGDTSLDISGKADKDTDAVAGNLAEFDANGNPVDSGIAKGKIAEIEGKVTELGATAGISEGIADSISAGTAQEIVFRQSGGDGVNYVKRFKGKTLAWNQLCDPTNNVTGNIGVEYNGITVDYDNATGKYRVHGTATANYDRSIIEYQNTYGHFYLLSAQGLPTGASGSVRCYANTGATNEAYNGDIKQSKISGEVTRIYIYVANGTSVDMYFSFNIHDLTLANLAGLTFAQFKALYPDIYSYNAGTLISNDAEELETVGFNQWDEEWEVGALNTSNGSNSSSSTSIRTKNYIPVFPSTTYYFRTGWAASGGYLVACYYDANKAFLSYTTISQNTTFSTPAGAAFMRFYVEDAYGTTYNHDICINLSDASKNGTYEPYWKRRIELNLATLKDKDGNLVFPYAMNGRGDDFDKILPDANGQMTIAERLWDRRAYQSGDESDASVITDGQQYTFVKLATPVVSELAEPIPNAILVDELGTEKAVFPEHEDGSPSAPLCTDSNYSISVKNLLAKLNE